MTPTYAGADWVLILDRELQEVSGTIATEEQCARVLMSGWNGRYWTAQEAFLSRRKAVQFHNHAMVWRHASSTQENIIHQNSLEDGDVLSRARLHSSIMSLIRLTTPGTVGSTLEYDNPSKSRILQFEGVWNSLLGKSSSKAKDLHVVLANLLDLSTREILEQPDTERAKSILCSYQHLPLEILFRDGQKRPNHDEKVSDEDRWIPQFPAGSPSLALAASKAYLEVRGDGLFISYDTLSWNSNTVLDLNFDSDERPYKFRIDNVQGRSYWVELQCLPGDLGPYTKTSRKILLLEEPIHCSRAPGRGLLGAGAIFSVSEATESMLQLIYDSPIVYGLWKGVCTESTFTDCATAVSSVELTNLDILVKSDISSWPKPHFKRPLNLTLYTTSDAVLRLLLLYPIYVLFLTLLITCFEAEVFSISVFGAIFAILTTAALAAHLVLYFQYLRRRILYMQSFDDQLDPQEEWWVIVEKYMAKVRWWKAPLQCSVFKIVVYCVKAWKPLQKNGAWFSAAEQKEGGVELEDLTRNGEGGVTLRGEV